MMKNTIHKVPKEPAINSTAILALPPRFEPPVFFILVPDVRSSGMARWRERAKHTAWAVRGSTHVLLFWTTEIHIIDTFMQDIQ